MFSFLYHCHDFYRTRLYTWVTRRVSYKKQELLTLCMHLISFLVRSVLFIFVVFCVVLLCVFTFLFVGVPMFYLCYLCLFVHCGVQHILCYVFVLFFFVLCTLCCQFLWIVHFWLPLRYSLTFIFTYCSEPITSWIDFAVIIWGTFVWFHQKRTTVLKTVKT